VEGGVDLFGPAFGERRALSSLAVREDDRPPICPRCGVTMVPAALSAGDADDRDWVCLECEELDEPE
jgi:tRNA(Ile2) C34 agmatinyltransferase TiaS